MSAEAATQVANAWTYPDDATLWRMLSNLLASHTDWTNHQHRSIIQAWAHIRSKKPWQSKLLRVWPRWKQHRSDLALGLHRIAHLSWAEKCRFCEIWSASRPVMAPFCGVADILLNLPEQTNETSNMWPRTTSRERPPSDDERLPPPSRSQTTSNPKVIIVSDTDALEQFSNKGPSQQLLHALQDGGYSWALKTPWLPQSHTQLSQLKGLIFWSYRHFHHDYAHEAMALERACQQAGVPVLNSIVEGWDTRHSALLGKLSHAGVACPKFQRFVDIEDINIPYPLILRVDGIHLGREMHLVQNAREAKLLLQRKRREFLSLAHGPSTLPPPNLALEYVDVADRRGRYHKHRALVIGDSVILRHHLESDHWLVNFATSDRGLKATRARAPALNDLQMEQIRAAGRATGSDVTALDFSTNLDGNLVFWEANRMFRMNGDTPSHPNDSPKLATGSRRAAMNRCFRESLLKLLRARLSP